MEVDNLLSSPPISSLIKLIKTNPALITPELKSKAFAKFQEITGLEINSTKEINLTCWFVIIPVLIISLILLWVFVLIKIIPWHLALYLSGFNLLILYVAGLLYRVLAKQYEEEELKNFENAIVMWSQGLLGVACSISP